MARLLFDFLIVAAISKEILELARERALNQELFLTITLLFPSFLGTAPEDGGLGASYVIRSGT